MGILDSILLAFVAGMAVRDLWPRWIRRAAEPKRVSTQRGAAQQAVIGRVVFIQPVLENHVVELVRARPKSWTGRSLPPGTRR